MRPNSLIVAISYVEMRRSDDPPPRPRRRPAVAANPELDQLPESLSPARKYELCSMLEEEEFRIQGELLETEQSFLHHMLELHSRIDSAKRDSDHVVIIVII